MTSVSVVIPTLDKAERLRLTLAGLAAQRDWRGLEVVVVDDGCTDATPDVVEQAAATLPVRIVQGPRRGRAAARNAGVRESAGDTLVFLDDDVVVGPRFLAAHCWAQRDRHALVHGRLRELPRGMAALRPEAVARDGLRLSEVRHFASPLERCIEAIFCDGHPPVAGWLMSVGANLSIGRRAWDRVGGFDESFGRSWGCEDLEFGFRAVADGIVPRFAPDAYGGHLTHPRPARWREHAMSLRHFRALHPEPEVAALERLLHPQGSVDAFLAAVDFSGAQAAAGG